MSKYLQTSTANPYGHRPWATRIYTGFESYAFLKQPQNAIIREDVNMRPEIYRPPEMKSAATLGDMTIVGGSGRILRRARRSRGLGLIPAMVDRSMMMPRSNIIVRGPISNGGPVLPGPMPVWSPAPPAVFNPPPVKVTIPFRPICEYAAPPPGCNYIPAASSSDPCGRTMSCSPPFQILPPPIVPPPPQIVGSGPGGTIYALPGDATTPGSPFAPASPAQLPLPAGAIAASASDAAAAAATTPAVSASSFADWFNAQTLISGVANGYIAIGGALAVYFFAKKKR